LFDRRVGFSSGLFFPVWHRVLFFGFHGIVGFAFFVWAGCWWIRLGALDARKGCGLALPWDFKFKGGATGDGVGWRPGWRRRRG